MKPLKEWDLELLYKDFLDSAYEPVEIAGLSYSTSVALKEVDPIAFRCGFNDWLDSEVTEGNLFEKDGEYFNEDPSEEESEEEGE